MGIEMWLQIIVTAIVIPSVAWLVKEVLSLRNKMVELETRFTMQAENCQRHLRWNEDTTNKLNTIATNIARPCQHNNLHFDNPN